MNWNIWCCSCIPACLCFLKVWLEAVSILLKNLKPQRLAQVISVSHCKFVDFASWNQKDHLNHWFQKYHQRACPGIVNRANLWLLLDFSIPNTHVDTQMKYNSTVFFWSRQRTPSSFVWAFIQHKFYKANEILDFLCILEIIFIAWNVFFIK